MSSVPLNEDEFKLNFFNLRLNIVQGKTINFLDLMISFDEITHKLSFSLFLKPSNTFSYLKSDSNHPEFIFKNIPKSLFIRVRRICSLEADYYYQTRKLIVQLLSRGYSFESLFSLQIRIGRIDRSLLIPYKLKCRNNYNDSYKLLFSTVEYIRQLISTTKKLDFSFVKSKLNFEWLNEYNLKLFHKISDNILSILIHKRPLQNSIKFTRTCNDLNCFSCKFINNNSYILLNSGLVVPIINNCDCNSKNVVYVIKCSLCNVFYIGQTKRSRKDRIAENIRDIKKFILYTTFSSEVGMHLAKSS